LWVAGLFLLADLSMQLWKRWSGIILKVFEQHQDIWLQPLRKRADDALTYFLEAHADCPLVIVH